MHLILTTAPCVVDFNVLPISQRRKLRHQAIHDLTKDTQLESGGGGIRTYIFWLQNLSPATVA